MTEEMSNIVSNRGPQSKSLMGNAGPRCSSCTGMSFNIHLLAMQKALDRCRVTIIDPKVNYAKEVAKNAT